MSVSECLKFGKQNYGIAINMEHNIDLTISLKSVFNPYKYFISVFFMRINQFIA